MELPEVRFKNILYATDDSKDARCAQAYAVSIAKQYNAKVTMLHVVQELKDMVAFDFGIERSVAAKKWFSVNQEYYEELKRSFEDLGQGTYDGSPIEIDEMIMERGNPIKKILEIAREKQCDLIILGRQGKAGLEDSKLGDTVRGVIRRSQVPVMVIHQNAEV